jgi:hypothetical protein
MPCPTADPFLVHAGVRSRGSQDPERQHRREPRLFRRAFRRHRGVRLGSAQGWRLSDAGLIGRHAIELSMHDIPGRRCASRRCAVAHGRSSRRIDQDGFRSRASKDLEREKVRSPYVPQTKISSGRGLGRRSEHCWWHAAYLSEHPGSDRRRYPSRQRSLLAGHPLRNPQPKSLKFRSLRCWRPSR